MLSKLLKVSSEENSENNATPAVRTDEVQATAVDKNTVKSPKKRSKKSAGDPTTPPVRTVEEQGTVNNVVPTTTEEPEAAKPPKKAKKRSFKMFETSEKLFSPPDMLKKNKKRKVESFKEQAPRSSNRIRNHTKK